MIKIHDLFFKPFISKQEIEEAVKKIAQQIEDDYQGKTPVFLGVLNGAFAFVAALSKEYNGDCEIEFTKLSSYQGTQSTKLVQRLIGVENLKGRDVIVLEDIVDTGHTLTKIIEILKEEQVASFKIATLFYKPEAYHQAHTLDYVGIEIPNKFIVGFGLDYDGLGRNLPEIYQLKEKQMIKIVLFGPPGAGKGTQATILKKKYDLMHLSTGDIFRYHMKNDTPLGMEAKSYIESGRLVPDKVTVGMLKDEVNKQKQSNGFIFDGFPRTEVQADALKDFLAEKGEEVNAMIALEVSDEILVKRLLERGKTSGRKDDANEKVIRKRIKIYHDETSILKSYYQEKGKYYGVNGEGSIEEITARLSDVIDQL